MLLRLMTAFFAGILFVPWSQSCPVDDTDANLTTPTAITAWNAAHVASPASPGVIDQTVDPKMAREYRTCITP